ncbi:MAG: hypothetical protein JSU92_02200, partial [Deltaproteobacteria bacterium]
MNKLLSLFAAKRGKIVAGALTLALAGEIAVGGIWNSVSPNISFAGETEVQKTVFEPEEVDKGETQTYEFSIRADYDATFTMAELIVINGDMGSDLNRVQSATIILNDKEVLGSADISEAVDRIEVPVRLSQNNELIVSIGNENGEGSYLTIQIDYEVGPTGPIFSGPQQYPFVCRTEYGEHHLGQPLVDNEVVDGQGIQIKDETGVVIGYSKDCLIPTQVDYFYRWDGTFYHLADPTNLPGNIDETVTSEGDRVKFIVRLERGTINRFIYGIAMLVDPSEDLESPWDLSAWNNKLVYSFGGGVGIGHDQGILGLGLNGLWWLGLLYHEALPLGYAVVISTGNVTIFNMNILLGGETALMVKDHFVNRYGEPEYTISAGFSGGGLQQYVYSQNWPGLLDGIVPSGSYPDMDTQTIPAGDCNLLEYYFDVVAPWPDWLEGQKDCTFGGPNCEDINPSQENRKLIEGMNSTVSNTECCAAWQGLVPLCMNPLYTNVSKDLLDLQHPQELVKAVKWTHADNLVTIFGLDEYGYARTYWDNVGVQYGLQALKEGNISIERFLDINARIGGWKQTHEMVPEDLGSDPWSIRNANIPTNDEVAPRT